MHARHTPTQDTLVFPGMTVTGSPSACFLTWPLGSQCGRIISLGSISSDLGLAWTWPGLHIILLGQVGQRQLLVMEEAQVGPLKAHSGKGLYL